MTESKANIYGSFVKYAIAIGFYRGVNFLLVPILPALLGVAGYGLFNLTQLTAQMILPIVGLNAATGILREGAEDVGVGQKIFNSQNNLSIIIVLLLLPVIYLVDRSTSNWVTYAVALSLLDVILLNRLTLLRASDNVNSYLILTLAKIGGFLAIIFFLKHVYQEIDLATVLLFQLGWYGVVTFGSINWKKYTFEISRSVLAPVFAYTLVLIPHSFFQWVINNSDKYIVKFLYGDLAVGEYSIIYNIAMIFFLLNSGISLTLPQFIFKNYENWMKARVRRKFIIGYSILSFLASACIIIAAFIELNFLRLTSISTDQATVYLILSLLLSGFYVFGIYYFYGNFILYHRKSKILMIQTVIAAILNLTLNSFMISLYGMVGAAISILLTYVVYTSSVIYWAGKVERNLNIKPFQELFMIPIVIVLIFLSGWIVSNIA